MTKNVKCYAKILNIIEFLYIQQRTDTLFVEF